mmetsp:Transcript_6541/g.16777  ORF Transcript_6541/g.16777 Transcript_6541/m.16777 type:complete len:134 (-) Transcript_6541:322-723(-)
MDHNCWGIKGDRYRASDAIVRRLAPLEHNTCFKVRGPPLIRSLTRECQGDCDVALALSSSSTNATAALFSTDASSYLLCSAVAVARIEGAWKAPWTSATLSALAVTRDWCNARTAASATTLSELWRAAAAAAV